MTVPAAVVAAGRAVRSTVIEASLAVGDLAGMAAQRRRLARQAGGRVLDLGAGSGRNLRHLRDADVVVALDPDPRAVRAARRRASPRPVLVVRGDAQALPFPDGSFDVVVVALALCTIPDTAVALAEVRRVLRPGGELRYLEHVVSPRPRLAALQRRIDPVWGVLAAGCSLSRDTGAAIRAAGFDVLHEFRSGDGGGTVIAGRARRRPTPDAGVAASSRASLQAT